MKYYIDNKRLVVYKEIPEVLPLDLIYPHNRFFIDNPNENKIYLDILERVDELWIKLRFYENRKNELTGETRLEIFDAYTAMLPYNYIKIEGLHDIDVFDGRFNFQALR